MSRFIDKLNQISRATPQPMGFRTAQPTSVKPKMQLVARLSQDSAEKLFDYVTRADAGLLRISKSRSAVKILQKIAEAIPDIPWGASFQNCTREEIEELVKIDCDFLVFAAGSTPLTPAYTKEVGTILEVEPSLSEGLLRATNELPVDAVLIASEDNQDHSLTWQHLMLYQRFSDLLNKPLLVPAPSNVTSDELQTLWDAGVGGAVIEIKSEQPPDRFKELRQAVDNLTFPSSRRSDRIEPMLPRTGQESRVATTEEEGEEDE